MTQSMMEGIAISDNRGRLVFANRALEQLLGYESGELVGRSWTALFPEMRRWRTEGWTDTNPPQIANRYEASLLHKDGSTVPVVANSCPLSDGDRDQVVLSTFTVLREQQELLDQEPQLDESVLLSEQAAGIIHELSNSLTIVFLQAQMLSKDRRLAPPVEQNLNVIRDQARLMMEMVSDLRATADPNQVRPEPTDVNQLILRTLDLQMHQLQAEGIRVTTELEEGLPFVGADPYKLQQVLVNLINNARQAMAATPESRQLTITTRSIRGDGVRAPAIRILISDNGPGIHAQVMPLIFEPFFTTKSGDGMGLGLPICEQIVERHGGKLRAENNPSGGATFVLDLPVAEKESREGLCRQAESSGTLSMAAHRSDQPNAHILVVDDAPAVAVSVGRILQDQGFQVTAATEAEQALALLREARVDLIVSDIKMPSMDGQEFWQAVRDYDPDLADRIIFATGDSSAQRAQSFLEECGCAWIEKPFQAEELLRLIRDTLPAAES
ncbi:MAG: response regulator [Anaerolineae bacterium]